MQAANLDLIFDVETAVESACKAVLEQAGFKAYIQQENVSGIIAPYVAVQLSLGAATGHRGIDPNGKAWLDAWEGTLGFEIATKRSKDQNHSIYRASIRRFIQYSSDKFGEDVLPYHALTMIKEAGTVPQIRNDDDEDVSQISFSVIISVRKNAWPG